MQSSLIVENGAMYFTQDDDTYAIDARTCAEIWHVAYKPVAKVAGIANRGVAYLDGVLYRGTMDSHCSRSTRRPARRSGTTGRLRWYFQLVPNDYHDWDTTVPQAIFTAPNGKAMFAFAGKDGYLFLLDAATHAVAAKVPVTTITNVSAPITPEGTFFCPNMGVQWNGPAYSERDKLVYINSVDWCSTIKLGPAHYVKGAPFLGSTNGSGQRGEQRTGWLHAVDPLSGKTVWQYHAAGPMVAGITVTASGLLFTGEYTGLFDVFDASNGKVLYQFQTGAPMGGGVVTYTVGGKQYVAASSGDTSVASLRGSGAGIVFVFAP